LSQCRVRQRDQAEQFALNFLILPSVEPCGIRKGPKIIGDTARMSVFVLLPMAVNRVAYGQNPKKMTAGQQV
jgi:hypothetical protein